jgi:hypothetical protein
VVSLAEDRLPTLADVRAGLEAAARATSSDAPHIRAFAAWVLGRHSDLSEPTREAIAALGVGAQRTAAHVAALGYASAASMGGPELDAVLLDGLGWLGERAWFRPQQPLTLEADGIAALGISLGAKHLESTQAEWLKNLVVRSAQMPDLSPLSRSLFIAACEVIGAPGRQTLIGLTACARMALAARGIGQTPSEAITGNAWREAIHYATGSAPEAALALATLNALTDSSLPARLGRLEVSDVVRILQGVQHSLRRWAWEDAPRTSNSGIARWDIENEYHVQALLWAVLAPIFPDLSDEQTLPPVGQKYPRVDLAITSMGLVVEAKFVRPQTRFQDIIGEIAEDASLYGTDLRLKHLVPFIWDDSARSEEHPTLLRGLQQLPMVAGAIVVSRPGKMQRRTELAERNDASAEARPSRRGQRHA